MPEAKNTFLKAKMNQDLDDRLLPNGEYRTAQNVLVGKSEEDSVGTLQNIRGNQILDDLTKPANSFIIGYLMDATSNRIFAFFTDNANEHSIRSHKLNFTGENPEDWKVLVEGAFLNFSTDFPILNVNLLEDLLFWTDNRNQPRKINVTHSLGYYTEEHQISVAKYNPYQPISLVKQEIEAITNSPASPGATFEIAENTNIVPGMIVLSKSGSTSVIAASDFITVDSVSTTSPTTTITLSDNATISQGDVVYFLSSTMTDKSGDAQWPGDPSYLESRFVRFGYRFKFDDNEYSIFSPFTQIAFIPKQKGYFTNGQEQLAVNSTILEWFENGINNIDLIIPLPDKANNVLSSYKIKEIEILYKESDQIPVKVIDTIIPTGTDNYYVYNYQSRKPIKTLPEAQTVRVYDKVPVLANTQEVVSNRVIYGNFKTNLNPPSTINYTVNIQEKSTTKEATNFVEYPNHTVKQNRNYQIGFVLSDKYGRQSDVILSPVSTSSTDKSSTIFAPYISDDPEGSGTPDANYYTDLREWFGNSLVLNLLSPITGGNTGLYASYRGDGFDIDLNTSASITDTTYSFALAAGGNNDIPQENDYMRGEFVDYVEVTEVNLAGGVYTITTSGRVNDIYANNPEATASTPDRKYAYEIDVNGWYSYKIVVKQTEQEYYNVYLPSAINGNEFPTDKTTDTATSVSYITLINDNINKVPRDLAEVGPDQKQYRSSVRLFGRVQPTFATGPIFGNQQYFPLRTADTSTAVGNTEDILGNLTTLSPETDEAVFQYDSNPIVARISTNKEFGINATEFGITGIADRFSLAVYETEPVVSALDIYWETSQTGLISDLNAETLTGFEGPVALEGWDDNLNENSLPNDNLSENFQPVDSDNNQLTGYGITLDSIINGEGDDVTSDGVFTLEQNPSDTGQYRIKLNPNLAANPLVFVEDSPSRDVFTFNFTIEDQNDPSSWGSVELSQTLELTNTDPTFSQQSANEYYYFYDDSDTNFVIHNFKTFSNNNAQNGSSNNTLRQDELTFELGGADANLFTLNSTTGELKPNVNGVAAGYNTYTITVTLRDANGDGGAGDAGSEIINTYYIIKGFTPLNIDPSKTSISAYIEFDNAVRTAAWIFYIAENQLSQSDLPSVTADTTTLQRLGTEAFSDGTFQFGVENAYVSGDGPHLYGGELEVDIYYRNDSSGTWDNSLNTQPPKDLNNDNSQYNNSAYPGQMTITNNVTTAPSLKQNLFYAQDIAGEYAFVVKFAHTPVQNIDPNYVFDADVYLRDLHYLSQTQTQEKYEYTIFTNGGNGWSSSTGPFSLTGPTEQVYSDQPLGEYNTKFWEDANLATVWEPPTENRYYLVRLIDSASGISGISNDYKYKGFNVTEKELVSVIKIAGNGDVDRTSTTANVALRQISSLTVLETPVPRSTKSSPSEHKYYSW